MSSAFGSEESSGSQHSQGDSHSSSGSGACQEMSLTLLLKLIHIPFLNGVDQQVARSAEGGQKENAKDLKVMIRTGYTKV